MEIPDQKAYPSPPPPASPAQVPQANVQWGPHFSRIHPPTHPSTIPPKVSTPAQQPPLRTVPPGMTALVCHTCFNAQVTCATVMKLSLTTHDSLSSVTLDGTCSLHPGRKVALKLCYQWWCLTPRPLSDSRKTWHLLRRYCMPSTIRYLPFTPKVIVTERNWQLFLPLMLQVLKFLPHSMFSTFLLVKFISYANQHNPQ